MDKLTQSQLVFLNHILIGLDVDLYWDLSKAETGSSEHRSLSNERDVICSLGKKIEKLIN